MWWSLIAADSRGGLRSNCLYLLGCSRLRQTDKSTFAVDDKGKSYTSWSSPSHYLQAHDDWSMVRLVWRGVFSYLEGSAVCGDARRNETNKNIYITRFSKAHSTLLSDEKQETDGVARHHSYTGDHSMRVSQMTSRSTDGDFFFLPLNNPSNLIFLRCNSNFFFSSSSHPPRLVDQLTTLPRLSPPLEKATPTPSHFVYWATPV
ncbi:hypothetical protein K445DRAFT_119362 [Daldinia sp. EC12]|nr:hypothetical protein K445DRAFT_119362 [Daldinia sp. EC12]